MISVEELTTEDYDAMLVYLMVHENSCTNFFEDMSEEEKDICADAIFEATAKERREALATAKPVIAAKEKSDAANKNYKAAKGELRKSFKLQAGNAAFQSEEERKFRHKYDDEKEDIVDDPFVTRKTRAANEKDAAREEYWHKKNHAKEVMKATKKMVRDKQNEKLKKFQHQKPTSLHSDKPVYEVALQEDAAGDELVNHVHTMIEDSRNTISRAVDNFILRLESGDSPDKEELISYCNAVKASDLYVEAATKMWTVVPEKSVGQIKFGANKVQVENIIKEEDEIDADYDSNGNCILVEIGGDIPVTIGGVKIMPCSQKQAVAALQQKDKDLKVSEHGCTSAKLSVHVSFSGGATGKVTKVSAGKKGYYA